MTSLMVTRFKLLATLALVVTGATLIGVVIHEGHVNLFTTLGIPVWAAMVALVLYVWGLLLALRAIGDYSREEVAINDDACSLLLGKLAAKEISIADKTVPILPVGLTVTEAFGNNRQVMQLLACRIEGVIHALRRGSPLLSMDSTEMEDRHFPGPERKLRALMDIVLNVGIAGTFASLIFAFTGDKVVLVDASSLLSHIGPGLVSGLAGIFANVALRVCHTVLIGAQENLAGHVDDVIDQHFLAHIPKSYTSPVDRLANVFATKFSEMMNTLATILTKQLAEVMSGIQQQFTIMTEHTGAIASASGQWGEVAERLEKALGGFLQQQEKTFLKWRSNADEIRQACDQAISSLNTSSEVLLKRQENEANQSLQRLTDTHVQWVKQLLLDEEQRRQSWLNTQEQVTIDLITTATALFRDEAIAHFKEVNAEFERLLAGTKETFADAVNQTLVLATTETVQQIDMLRIEAGKLAQALDSMQHYTGILYEAGDAWREKSAEQYEQVRLFLAEFSTRVNSTLDQYQQAISTGQDKTIEAYSGLLTNIERVNVDVSAAVKETIVGMTDQVGQTKQVFGTMVEHITEVQEKSAASIKRNIDLLLKANTAMRQWSDEYSTTMATISTNMSTTAMQTVEGMNVTASELLKHENEMLQEVTTISDKLQSINVELERLLTAFTMDESKLHVIRQHRDMLLDGMPSISSDKQ